MAHSSRPRLTIGEYAAATQLTAKALRLYDEHGLLKPGVVDPSSGYRYYGTEQVATGRLVRTLRDMNLSLAQIRQVLDTFDGMRPGLLRDLLHEAEQRLARERLAYQSALQMLRSKVARESTRLQFTTVPEQVVAVVQFTSNRREFLERALQQQSGGLRELQSARRRTQDGCTFVLLEPLTSDDALVEMLIPIDADASLGNLTTRHLAGRQVATIETSCDSVADGFAACTDALFDWFDRKGVQALGHPEVLLEHPELESGRALVRWAFSSDAAASGGLHD